MSDYDIRKAYSISANEREIERAEELARVMRRSRSDMIRVLVDEKRQELGLDAPSFLPDVLHRLNHELSPVNEPA